MSESSSSSTPGAAGRKPTTSIEEREGGFVCLVDGDGEYNLSEDKLRELITYVDPNSTQDYSIVGIMGCQSSGKSTLLNRLFETKFQMMDSDRGRQQTTKGIWLDAARNTHNLVVMDLEGTDSGERGEDRTTFERQTILYGLALCEILIVNMWEHDIGRYTASNYGVLKTVFEVNLQLFKQQGKTMLLFIVRDHIEQVTPFQKLKKKLLDEVHNIWNELRKPAEYETANLLDFFDFRFEALPHKVLMSEAFEQEASALRGKFIDPTNPEYFLDTPYHGEKSVPAEGFAKYSHGIWETIRSNKDLNLPSQKEMLATFRCDELSAQALSKCLVDVAPLRALSGERFLPDAGVRVGALLTTSLTSFDEGSAKYASEVVSRKRKELLVKLMEPCSEILTEQLSRVVRTASRDFTVALLNALPQSVPTRAFYNVVAKVREEALANFHTAKDSLFTGLPPGATLSVVKSVADLENAFDRGVAASRKDQFIFLSSTAMGRMKELMEQQVGHFLRIAPSDMWSQIGSLFNASLSSATAYAYPYLVALRATEHERTTLFLCGLLEQAEKFVYEHVLQQKAILPMKLRGKFEEKFVKDEQGMRRRWTAKDDIRSLYLASRDEALKIIPLFSRFGLREFWGEEADEIAFSPPLTAPPVPGSPGYALVADTQAARVKKSAKIASKTKIKSVSEIPRSLDQVPTDLELEAAESKLPSDEHDVKDNSQNSSEDENEEEDIVGTLETAVTGVSGLRSRRALPDAVALRRAVTATMPGVSVQGPSTVLVTPEQAAELQRQFLIEIEGILADAQREQERNVKSTSLPPWAILAMLVLGYNEIMSLLRSPIVLVLVIVFGFIALIVHSLGMTKPVMAMLTNSLGHAYESFQAAIAPPSTTTSSSTSTTRSHESVASIVNPVESTGLSSKSGFTTAPMSTSEDSITTTDISSDMNMTPAADGIARFAHHARNNSATSTTSTMATGVSTTTSLDPSVVMGQSKGSVGNLSTPRRSFAKSYATMPSSSFASVKKQNEAEGTTRKRAPVLEM